MQAHAPARIAVLIPCFNEAAAIAAVIADFQLQLRQAGIQADIYVYDNNSTDHTAAAAAAAGAIVRHEMLRGKGNVVRRMFGDIEADAYMLVDGDDTYDAAVAPEMLRLLFEQQLDMVNGQRVAAAGASAAYRRGHRFGNRLLSKLVRLVFGDRVRDMLSGYRVFSRRFVKTFPALAAGFETETEFTVHALDLMMPIGELPVTYRPRGEDSASKLRTYRDGLRILRMILVLVKEERPLPFFSLAASALLLLATMLGAPVVATFLRTGLVPRLPTAVLATGIVLVAVLSFCCGLILDSVARARREAKRFAYLAIPRWTGPWR